MKVLIRNRHKEHLRPRAHVWIGGDTLCKKVSCGTIKREKYMLVERTKDFRICQTCLQVEMKNE